MKEQLYILLKQFEVLTEKEINIIVENTQVAHYKKGDFLLKEGQISKSCYMVLEGCVREYYIVDGEEKSTAFYTEGQPVNAFTSSTWIFRSMLTPRIRNVFKQ